MTDMIAAEPAVVERILTAGAETAECRGEPGRRRSAGDRRRRRRSSSPAAARPSTAPLAVAEILREAGARRSPGPRAFDRARAGPGIRAVAGSAIERARHRRLARGRDRCHERRAHRGPSGRRADRAHHGQRPIARRRPGRDRRRDRRARPELVPHGRLRQPDRRGDGGGRPPDRVRDPPVDVARDLVAPACGVDAGARRGDRDALAGVDRLLVIASGADRSAGRELVPEGRGRRLAAGRVPRPRDVPARPPRRDGRADRPRRHRDRPPSAVPSGWPTRHGRPRGRPGHRHADGGRSCPPGPTPCSPPT